MLGKDRTARPRPRGGVSPGSKPRGRGVLARSPTSPVTGTAAARPRGPPLKCLASILSPLSTQSQDPAASNRKPCGDPLAVHSDTDVCASPGPVGPDSTAARPQGGEVHERKEDAGAGQDAGVPAAATYRLLPGPVGRLRLRRRPRLRARNPPLPLPPDGAPSTSSPPPRTRHRPLLKGPRNPGSLGLGRWKRLWVLASPQPAAATQDKSPRTTATRLQALLPLTRRTGHSRGWW